MKQKKKKFYLIAIETEPEASISELTVPDFSFPNLKLIEPAGKVTTERRKNPRKEKMIIVTILE
jgi:hypothetical protein